jgi:predicted N-acetyltransferase YhbS
MTITLRRARPEDIPVLEHLIQDSVRVLSQGHYTSQQIESALIHVFGVDTQLIDDGTYFVAEAAGQIVGCGGWSTRKTLYGGDQAKESGPDALLDPATEPARIRAFFVHPQWARQGIGSRIIRASEEAARQASFKDLELVATLPGEPLYAAFGYIVVERLEVRLPDGTVMAGARMTKKLTGASGLVTNAKPLNEEYNDKCLQTLREVGS